MVSERKFNITVKMIGSHFTTFQNADPDTDEKQIRFCYRHSTRLHAIDAES